METLTRLERGTRCRITQPKTYALSDFCIDTTGCETEYTTHYGTATGYETSDQISIKIDSELGEGTGATILYRREYIEAIG
jgi:hypothetical protein